MRHRQWTVYRLITFGGLRLESDGDAPAPRLRRPWLAVLAVIAASGDHGVLRERIITLFWPESDEDHARQSARQAFYGLRQELGHDVIVANGASLTLHPSLISSDVGDFRLALSAGHRDRAVQLAQAPFLDGFYVPSAPAFERWAEEERMRVEGQRTTALATLAGDAAKAGEHDTAVKWWRELTAADPLNGRYAAGLLTALAARGDRAEGLLFARQHEALVRRELEAEPDPAVRRAEAALRVLPVDASRAEPPSSTAASTNGMAPQVEHPAATPTMPRGWRPVIAASVTLLALVVLVMQRSRLEGRQVGEGGSMRTSLASASTRSATAARLYEEGLRAFYRDDMKSARQLMRAALEDDSGFAMAAYHEVRLTQFGDDMTPDGRTAAAARRTALALAQRASERERLLITAYVLTEDHDPAALVVAESLATRFPDDAQGMSIYGRILKVTGLYARSAAAFEHAIQLDSTAEHGDDALCLTCQHLGELGDLYTWWDSLAASERTARRYLTRRPAAFTPLYQLTLAAARRGDSATTYATFRRMLSVGVTDRSWKLNLDVRLEEYDTFLRDVPQLLSSSSPYDWNNGSWLLLIALRNQGRLREATQFLRFVELHWLPRRNAQRTIDAANGAILPFERGEYAAAAHAFRAVSQNIDPAIAPGISARKLTWQGTLAGMAIGAGGDTAALRAMADSVERWGRGSSYGRDHRAHHYLRGLLQARVGDHAGAVEHYRAAVHSPTLGFTRVNYELGRSLLAIDRPSDAIAVLQPALRGEIDASNLYVTRTELHEVLAQAFARAGLLDSAAVHYRAVVSAWRHADPAFVPRRDAAAAWLARQ